MDLRVEPSDVLQGECRVVGDKSISHRALMLGSIAEGDTLIEGFLAANDCLATLKICKALGVDIIHSTPSTVQIKGKGKQGLRAPNTPLNCENAGTAMRLFAGILSAQPFNSVLVGDESLSLRPMERVITPLRRMGAKILAKTNSNRLCSPLSIEGNPNLKGITYAMPLSSAQLKSSLLLAGLYATHCTQIIEKEPTRDHTERMLEIFGAKIQYNSQQITLFPDSTLTGQHVRIPGDFSAAAFFIVGACLTPNSHILIKQVGVNPTRIGLLSLLKQMGAKIILHPSPWMGNEPVADIEVWGSHLKGIVIPEESVANAIDEFPILLVAAACAEGQTVLRGAQELRFKETDRIAMMANGLTTLGVNLQVLPDGMVITGNADCRFTGGTVNSAGDHRIAMAFAMTGLRAQQSIVIKDCDNIAVSFPSFNEIARDLGLLIQQIG